MFDVVARQDSQRTLRRQPKTKQVGGNRPNLFEHLRITDLTPHSSAITRGDKGLMRPHPSPVLQALEQTRRQRSEWLFGTHAQDAIHLAHFNIGVADGYLAVTRRGERV
ncbi:hypothetical protein D3C72_1287360 [compost metagenome]